jgi:hypothetical protein
MFAEPLHPIVVVIDDESVDTVSTSKLESVRLRVRQKHQRGLTSSGNMLHVNELCVKVTRPSSQPRPFTQETHVLIGED